MMKRAWIVLCFSVIVFSQIPGCFATQESTPADRYDPAKPERAFTHKYNKINYWIFFPQKYGLIDKEWPVLMYLHGASERGKGTASLKQNITYHFFDSLKKVEAMKELPFVVVAPQCPKHQYWNPTQLYGVLQHVLSYTSADRNRLYLTGHSMGGFGTWNFACAFPDLFAAIVPVSGGGRSDYARKLVDVPVWAFHGKRDSVVSSRRTTVMVTHLKDAGGDVQMTLYPTSGHVICRQTYSNPELWDWLLAQDNSPKSRTLSSISGQ